MLTREGLILLSGSGICISSLVLAALITASAGISVGTGTGVRLGRRRIILATGPQGRSRQQKHDTFCAMEPGLVGIGSSPDRC